MDPNPYYFGSYLTKDNAIKNIAKFMEWAKTTKRNIKSVDIVRYKNKWRIKYNLK